MLPGEVIGLLKNARRPLVHVGQGVRIAKAIPEFFQFIESWGIPFVTARNANDICASDHPLYVGRPGTFAQRGANFAVQTCDLYIAIGTRLTLTQTGYNSKDYARNAVIVQVDIDQAELDKGTLRSPVRIQCDAAEFLRAVLSYPVGRQWPQWVEHCKSLRERYPVCLPEYKDEQYVNSYHFIDTLSDVLEESDTIVTDMGFAFQNTHQAFKVKKGQRLMTNCGLAPMGWGLPAAIGAAFATGKRVICITGEGGLMMNIQDLATVMHHKLNIKIFVFKNGGYATIKQTQELGFEGRLMGVNENTGLSFPNISTIAQANEIPSIGEANKNETVAIKVPLEKIIQWTLNQPGPSLCEITLSPDQPQAPRSLNRRNPGGTMNPTKLEDAYPFLEPKIVEEEMSCALSL